LFIEPHFKGRIPYGHLIQTEQSLYWFEFNGKKSFLWKVTQFTEQEKQLKLDLGKAGEVLIFPYWDIDHCLLIIRKDPEADENPTRFAVPYEHLKSIPFLEGD